MHSLYILLSGSHRASISDPAAREEAFVQSVAFELAIPLLVLYFIREKAAVAAKTIINIL
jgi:hypothetical protein